MSKWNNRITVFGFLVLLGMMILIGLLTPNRVFSPEENRDLQQLPKLSLQQIFTGQFMKEFETYTSDQFPGRDWWVGIKTRADLAIGKKDNGQVYFGKDHYLFPIDQIDEKQMKGNLFMLTQFIQGLSAAEPRLGISVLMAPTSSQIMGFDLPRYAPVPDEDKLIGQVKQAVKQASLKSGAKKPIFVDPQAALTGALAAHGKEQLYYRTDHHWTTLGAYTAYQAWARASGLSPTPPDRFSVLPVSRDFYGTSQSKTGLDDLMPDTIYAYKPKGGSRVLSVTLKDTAANGGVRKTQSLYDPSFLKVKDQYSYFLGGNHSLVDIQTDVANGKTLLLIKDSYANCFVPFLTDHYQRIVMVDLRYNKESLLPLIKEIQASDVMVLYNIIQFANDRNLVYLKI